MATELDLSNLEAFLRGELTHKDVSRSRNRIDRALVVTALLYADPPVYNERTGFFTVRDGNRIQLLRQQDRVVLQVLPGARIESTIAAMRMLGFISRTGVNVPDELKLLVDHYVGDPNGGIAKFYGPLRDARDTRAHTTTDEQQAARVAAQLKDKYSPAVIRLIVENLTKSSE